jgi:lysophospholipase L1-like esterase
MEFRLAFNPQQQAQLIHHQHKLMLMGSCFTENIGDKLIAHHFNVLQNPNGILFNPVSVQEAIENYIHCKTIGENDLFFLNEAYHSWQHHSRFSGLTAAEAVTKINDSVAQAHAYLKTADWLVITYGSAWIYQLTALAANATVGAVAANNHKAPADWFSRQLVSAAAVHEVISKTVAKLQAYNNKLKIIFTISPVRHLREGFVENNRSKAALINAVHQVVSQYSNVFYFPAYELVIDDLRDYRFYAEDMVHPNYAATNYVWGKFIRSSIDEPTQQLMQQLQELNIAMQHKPFNPASAAHTTFKTKYLNLCNELLQRYPHLNLAAAMLHFQ